MIELSSYLVFLLAFLPQFVDPSRGAVLPQFLVLGATIALLDTLYEVMLVHFVSGMRELFLHSPRLLALQTRVSGTVLVALGLRLAAQER